MRSGLYTVRLPWPGGLGVKPLVIGLVIVGFGTSAPEMLVSGLASWLGSALLGVGNAIGSNTTNVLLVLGVAACIRPLKLSSGVVRREVPVLFLIMALAAGLMWDGVLSRVDGIVLLLSMFAMVAWVGVQGMSEGRDDAEMADGFDVHGISIAKATIWVGIGFVCLLVGSRALVWGAVEIATAFGVSELVIGLTMVALGTSLPELATSIVAAQKNEHDIAVGNVIGSNMFNLLGVLGLPGLIAPGSLESSVMTRDYPFMVAATLVLVLLAVRGGRYEIRRPAGVLLLLAYVAYIASIFVVSGCKP